MSDTVHDTLSSYELSRECAVLDCFLVVIADTGHGGQCRVIEGEKFKVLQRMSKIHVCLLIWSHFFISFHPFHFCPSFVVWEPLPDLNMEFKRELLTFPCLQ